jgi:hypothetical protein
VDFIHPIPHRFYSGFICFILGTFTHPTGGGDGGLFHHFDNL